MKTRMFFTVLTLVTAGACDDARSKTSVKVTDSTTNTVKAERPAAVVVNPGAADQTAQANNTKINERDRGNDTVTPTDQGMSAEDTQITATIRRSMMDDDRLSFAAKNVKVITLNKRVTLRGPVSSDEEKTSIEALAKQANGVSVVDSQLEVKK